VQHSFFYFTRSRGLSHSCIVLVFLATTYRSSPSSTLAAPLRRAVPRHIVTHEITMSCMHSTRVKKNQQIESIHQLNIRGILRNVKSRVYISGVHFQKCNTICA